MARLFRERWNRTVVASVPSYSQLGDLPPKKGGYLIPRVARVAHGCEVTAGKWGGDAVEEGREDHA